MLLKVGRESLIKGHSSLKTTGLDFFIFLMFLIFLKSSFAAKSLTCSPAHLHLTILYQTVWQSWGCFFHGLRNAFNPLTLVSWEQREMEGRGMHLSMWLPYIFGCRVIWYKKACRLQNWLLYFEMCSLWTKCNPFPSLNVNRNEWMY